MAFASFVADAAIAVVQAAADEIGGPLAPELRRNAAALVYNVGQLGIDMDAAIGVLTDIDKLEDLAFNALDDYPAVVGTTLNRNQERNNQAALINFVRGLATVRFAERVGLEEYRDREQARARRDSSTEALGEREADANTRVFRSLRQLRAAVVSSMSRRRPRGHRVTAAPAARDRGDRVSGQRAAVALHCHRLRHPDMRTSAARRRHRGAPLITLPRPGFVLPAGQFQSADYASGRMTVALLINDRRHIGWTEAKDGRTAHKIPLAGAQFSPPEVSPLGAVSP